jgi:uncharacterized protein (DUF433 family)
LVTGRWRKKLKMFQSQNMAYQDRISINPDIRSGKPCIKGTRIAVEDVLQYLAGGMTTAEILQDFPDLKSEDIAAALEFADKENR